MSRSGPLKAVDNNMKLLDRKFAKATTIFYGIGGKRTNVSPFGKRLPSLTVAYGYPKN